MSEYRSGILDQVREARKLDDGHYKVYVFNVHPFKAGRPTKLVWHVLRLDGVDQEIDIEVVAVRMNRWFNTNIDVNPDNYLLVRSDWRPHPGEYIMQSTDELVGNKGFGALEEDEKQ